MVNTAEKYRFGFDVDAKAYHEGEPTHAARLRIRRENEKWHLLSHDSAPGRTPPVASASLNADQLPYGVDGCPGMWVMTS